jgi:hypothetical protein
LHSRIYEIIFLSIFSKSKKIVPPHDSSDVGLNPAEVV